MKFTSGFKPLLQCKENTVQLFKDYCRIGGLRTTLVRGGSGLLGSRDGLEGGVRLEHEESEVAATA